MQIGKPVKIDLSVGQVATRAGISISAIHFYEAKGLISSWRNTGNQRRFSRDVLRRLAVIKAGQRLGIRLATIGSALRELPTDRPPSVADWERVSSRWKEELDQRIECLIRLRDHLGECIGCGCLSLESCPLINPEDILSEGGTGARFLE
jgi:MerR family redox-sensitive transcriptional activator SoxR